MPQTKSPPRATPVPNTPSPILAAAVGEPDASVAPARGDDASSAPWVVPVVVPLSALLLLGAGAAALLAHKKIRQSRRKADDARQKEVAELMEMDLAVKGAEAGTSAAYQQPPSSPQPPAPQAASPPGSPQLSVGPSSPSPAAQSHARMARSGSAQKPVRVSGKQSQMIEQGSL